jgi:hypothetical protein
MKYIDTGKKRYRLAETITCPFRILELRNVVIDSHPLIKLRFGMLTVLETYPWDGPTGVSITKDNAEGTLYHDAGYELMQSGLLDIKYRQVFDELLRRVCMLRGMSKKWANIFYAVVETCGESRALPPKHPTGRIIEI